MLLDDADRSSIYLSEGLGHAFHGAERGRRRAVPLLHAVRPRREHGVHPLDPALGIDWPLGTPLLSGKDAAAPTLSEARAAGLLPTYRG